MDRKILISTLWIFLTANFIFCDVFSLHVADNLQDLLAGKADDTAITQEFLLVFALIMEIPILMILLARVLKYSLNRILNIIFAVVLIIVQAGTLFWGENTLHYKFFSAIEIATCIIIIGLAWKWAAPQKVL